MTASSKGVTAMRPVLVVLALLLLGTASPVLADALACGLKPLAPLGCSASNARCVCDADGNCHWVFDC